MTTYYYYFQRAFRFTRRAAVFGAEPKNQFVTARAAREADTMAIECRASHCRSVPVRSGRALRRQQVGAAGSGKMAACDHRCCREGWIVGGHSAPEIAAEKSTDDFASRRMLEVEPARLILEP